MGWICIGLIAVGAACWELAASRRRQRVEDERVRVFREHLASLGVMAQQPGDGALDWPGTPLAGFSPDPDGEAAEG